MRSPTLTRVRQTLLLVTIICLAFQPMLKGKEPDSRVVELAKELHDKGWIAYGARSTAGDWDIFLMRPDGSGSHNITNTPETNEVAPRFSPNGRKMLYRRLPKTEQISHDQWGFRGQLVMADCDGANPIVQGKEGEFPWASWSPDGRQIACLNLKGIEIYDLETKNLVRRMERKGCYQQLFWSPDGKWFCSVSNFLGEMWTVARLNVETGEINAVNSYQNCTPDWFPDSKHIILSYRPAGQENKYGYTQLWMAGGDGKDRRLVYGEDGRHIYGGLISPDGQYVMFTSAPKDGSGADKDGAPMGIIRLADTPMITGQSKTLRSLHPDAKDGPVIWLPMGWEPHWTYAEIGAQ